MGQPPEPLSGDLLLDGRRVFLPSSPDERVLICDPPGPAHGNGFPDDGSKSVGDFIPQREILFVSCIFPGPWPDLLASTGSHVVKHCVCPETERLKPNATDLEEGGPQSSDEPVRGI